MLRRVTSWHHPRSSMALFKQLNFCVLALASSFIQTLLLWSLLSSFYMSLLFLCLYSLLVKTSHTHGKCTVGNYCERSRECIRLKKTNKTKSDTNMWGCKSVFSSHILFFTNSLCQDYRGATVRPASRCCQTCQSVPARPPADQQLLTH